MPKTGTHQPHKSDKVMSDMQANYVLLNGCETPHTFKCPDDKRPGPETDCRSEYICQRCGGKVDARMAYWYIQGLTHGKPVQVTQ